MSTPKKRPYNSTSRRKQSEDTKNRITTAAKVLFESKGFEQVTIEDIAKTAQVSIPTVYAIFQSKKGIMLALLDASLSLDRFEALVELVKYESCPRKRLELTASIARQIYQAEAAELGSIRGAAILDPVFKELETLQEKRRYERQKTTVESMAKGLAFGKDCDLYKIRDILWALTGRDLYRMLVIERHWTPDEYEAWLANVLIQNLLIT